MVYENVIKILGPYLGKDNRLRVVLKYGIGDHRLVSYPKYLMELHLDRYLTEDETVDHIDGNPLNNDITNLRVLPRSQHCSNDALRNKDVVVTCAYCGKEFTIPGGKICYRNRKDRNQSGYFCSKRCIGKYGAEIQNGKRELSTVAVIIPDKFTLHKESAHSEKSEVEQPKFEEALTDNADGNLEPSLIEEGVETRQAEPKSQDKVKE